ncbi:LysR family transcriptional regulator [Burkholderia pseudomallei]|uniref:LysR family transcriptional regulator n=3 Tax=Burkholderia pseudomallei TaxID=28450 RepID=UPI001F4321DF|nr:LysR family transcriptional regulator [Burkholderia pseudomallei]
MSESYGEWPHKKIAAVETYIFSRWRNADGPLGRIQFFARVVEMGSLSKAAEAMGFPPSASRHLAALEQRLGVRLIERSTRRLFVTDVGQRFYEKCKVALDDITEAEEAATLTSSSPFGVLQVAASLSLILQHVAPLLPEFAQRYPHVRVELIAANRYVDITDNDIDVAIRIRESEPDSTLVIRPLATTRRILAASPEYIAQHGMPTAPQALSEHRYLGCSYHNPDELTFKRQGEVVTVRTAPLLDANDGQIVRVAALGGLGILAQPMYLIYDDLVAGRLIPLLLE